MSCVFKNIKWTRITSVGVASGSAPDLAGIYAYAEITTLSHLPLSITWKYVGKAASLTQRLGQHEDSREPNLALRDWIRLRTTRNKELWYAVTDLCVAGELETELIGILRPEFNKILYRGKNLHDSYRQGV